MDEKKPVTTVFSTVTGFVIHSILRFNINIDLESSLFTAKYFAL